MTPTIDSAAERRIRAHFDRFAPSYHATAFSGAGMAHLSGLDLAAVRHAASLAPSDRSPRLACDVGVGTGRISGEVLALGFELIGVDASAGMLAQASSVLAGATLRQGSLAGRLPVDDDHADLVTCLRVVKYLPDWPAAIAELARVARPGGIVCFDLANAQSPARFGYPRDMVWPATWRRAIRAIDDAGLDIVELRPGVHLPDPCWRAAAGARSAAVAAGVEGVLGTTLGRRGARSWTFLTTKRDR